MRKMRMVEDSKAAHISSPVIASKRMRWRWSLVPSVRLLS